MGDIDRSSNPLGFLELLPEHVWGEIFRQLGDDAPSKKAFLQVHPRICHSRWVHGHFSNLTVQLPEPDAALPTPTPIAAPPPPPSSGPAPAAAATQFAAAPAGRATAAAATKSAAVQNEATGRYSAPEAAAAAGPAPAAATTKSDAQPSQALLQPPAEAIATSVAATSDASVGAEAAHEAPAPAEEEWMGWLPKLSNLEVHIKRLIIKGSRAEKEPPFDEELGELEQGLQLMHLIQQQDTAGMESDGPGLLRLLWPQHQRHAEMLQGLQSICFQSAIITHASEMLRTSLNQAKLHGQDPASVYGLRGLLAHREGRLHHARVCLSRAVFLAPEEARLWFDRSQLMLDLQDWEACLDDLRGALELLPDCPSLYYTCGMILYAAGSMQQAQESFEKAVETVLVQEQKRRGSTRMISAALALQSTSHISQTAQHCPSGSGGTESKARWTRLGRAASLKKVASSGEGAECILRPDPRLWEGTKFITGAASPPDLTASLWYHLGCARASTNSYEGAAAALEQAHAYLPGHPAIMHELAKAYLAMGCVDAAEPLLTGVLSIQPGNAWALFRRGLCCMAVKDYDRAAADLSSAKAMLPDEPALAVDVKLIRTKWSEMVRQHMGPGPGGEAFVWDLALWPPALQKSLPH